MTHSIDSIRRLCEPVARRYGVKKLALFGSYAANRQRSDSDVDLLMDKGRIIGLWEYAGFVMTLEQALGAHVDVITYDSVGDAFMGSPINDEVVLYEDKG
ncbi:MAG: nucleotidyltransferase domain-containing protein [Oscillospiraceae bacterium]|jgi:predicted nucleotidyltransferase|nr:nucleotidyltransferase domain-containing protein [Oscillospiraceae bacterium]